MAMITPRHSFCGNVSRTVLHPLAMSRNVIMIPKIIEEEGENARQSGWEDKDNDTRPGMTDLFHTRGGY